ncbi:adenylosuccinate lyase [Candidatus Parvarchaeota archaeon]|nr:adenylosuccinate lyase [Candidatus Parvarchaeota archaeon]
MAVSPIDTRYKTEMNAIFEDKAKLDYWMQVEVALAHAHAKLGNIPKNAPEEIEKASKKVILSRVEQIEAEIHHDLMAMVKALSEKCTGGCGAFVHFGATSYDIEDTATAMMFRDAIGIVEKRVEGLVGITKKLALENAQKVCIARTHGQHAVPTTYGLKFALYNTELKRHLERLKAVKKNIMYGKMSGAAGTMATFGSQGMEIQKLVMDRLGLQPALVTNQVIQRDRHAAVMFVLALVAATYEKMAKEIRNLQRTEIMEISEPFSAKQVGSSTMPQKRNPHKSERICSLARVVRANVQVALENIALEHERDLTNSANERYIFSGSFITTDYMGEQLGKILEGLVFYDANIERNLEMSRGLVMAERTMIELTGAGLGRQEAHELVRTCAQEAFRDAVHLKHVLGKSQQVKKYLDKKKLDEIFDPKTYIGLAPQIARKAVEG